MRGSSGQVPAPGTYNVFGFSFAPMYNFGYKFRAGVALDGVYDHSANMKESYEEENGFYTPPAKKQMALGLSARGEFCHALLHGRYRSGSQCSARRR